MRWLMMRSIVAAARGRVVRWLVIFSVPAAANACSSATGIDAEAANLQAVLQTEIAGIPADYRAAGLSTQLVNVGLPLAYFPMILCHADSSGVAAANPAGVPRDLTLTYGANSCLQSPIGSETFVGVIRIQAVGEGYAATVTYTQFRHAILIGGSGTTAIVDGTVQVRSPNATTITIEQHTTEHAVAGSIGYTTDVTRVRDVTAILSDTSGHATEGGLYLPAAETVTGTLGLTYAGTTPASLSVALTTPVTFKPEIG
ncbi:MAG: hypothetical protein U0163_03665, partial [Gemmatimonadaceae bacterium]